VDLFDDCNLIVTKGDKRAGKLHAQICIEAWTCFRTFNSETTQHSCFWARIVTYEENDEEVIFMPYIRVRPAPPPHWAAHFLQRPFASLLLYEKQTSQVSDCSRTSGIFATKEDIFL
jgi:hypothetical protein